VENFSLKADILASFNKSPGQGKNDLFSAEKGAFMGRFEKNF